MNLKRNYIGISVAYILVTVYFTWLTGNIFGIFLIGILLAYHLYSISNLKEKLDQDKKTSVKTLESTLKKVERKSDENYHQFISLTKTLGSGLIMINDEGVIDFVNKDFLNCFKGESLVDKEYSVFRNIKPLYKFINESYLSESKNRGQIIYNDNYFDLVNTPIIDDNQFKGCLIIVHDITTLKTAEKFQKQFTADVSHELKTPLSVIKGFSELLDRDHDMDVTQRVEFVSLIKNESDRMESILNDLLVISKMDRLDYEIKYSDVNIADILQETINSLKIFVDKKKLKLTQNINECNMKLDVTKISLVFTNIIKNAINYTDKGTVDIRGYVEGNSYILNVTDSGIGIDESQFENIFKRFYRIDGDRSRDTGGSGLGLSISKNVVLRHGGDISIKSTINKGTTFKIKLPIKK